MVKALLRKAVAFLRKLYYKSRRRSLRNTAPSIICNNCFGGLIYHNLGLQFRSPTVNLYLSNQDFFTFAQSLDGFLSEELREVRDTDRNYPVGELTHMGQRIEIYFMHYPDFETAKRKWDERKARVDYNNLYLIFQTARLSDAHVKAVEALPYQNKLLVAGNNPTNSPDVITHPILTKADCRPGELLEYKSRFALRRHMDDIDYVGFLNRNVN